MMISPKDQVAGSKQNRSASLDFGSSPSGWTGKQPKPWGEPGPQTVRGGPEVCVDVLHHASPRDIHCLHADAESHSSQKPRGTRSRPALFDFTASQAVVGRVSRVEALTTPCGPEQTAMGSSLLSEISTRLRD